MTPDQFVRKWSSMLPASMLGKFAADVDQVTNAAVARNQKTLVEKVRKHLPDDQQTADMVCRIIVGKRPE